ncbi:MAG: hypothetical protein DMD59_11690 [Gemmatimonadetes bacterium]|nr:MAG: hypothetical protein DMD59_11690 [Gemmatimonadota bacterium]
MFVRRSLIPLALLAAACTDGIGPVPSALERPLAQSVASRSIPMLRQAKTAPSLATYQVSFWAYVGKASAVAVNYLPAKGQSVGDPFLRFSIPRGGLVAGANGATLKSGDSILVTLNIDPVSFLVDFQPSGVLFSKTSPAILGFWYGRANPDLNGDGVVDAADQLLMQQLAIWYQGDKAYGWSKQPSINDTTKQLVGAAVYHFSQYAVSW